MGINAGTRGCVYSLACSIGSMSLVCGNLMSINSFNEKISFHRGLFITSLGFVYFISLTDFFNKYFLETGHGQKLRKKYQLLVSDVMDITNKIVSAIQAALSCIAGYIVCNSSCKKSFLTASHYMSDAYAWFGTAYFVYDMWSMYKVHLQKIADKLKLIKDIDAGNTKDQKRNGLYDKIKSGGDGYNNLKKKSLHSIQHEHVKKMKKVPLESTSFLIYCLTHPVMTIHHVFLGSLGLLVIVYLRGGFGDCVYGFVYLMEISTPFVSIRSILSIMGLKNSSAYVINGIIMLITFFICRVLMWPYVYYWYSEIVNLSVLEAISSLPLLCKVGTLILFCPQIYWFYLMLRGAMKVFFPSKQQTKQQKSHKNSNNTVKKNSGENAQLPSNNNSTFQRS